MIEKVHGAIGRFFGGTSTSITFILSIIALSQFLFQLQPRYDAWEKDLNSLIGNRNLAFIAARYVVDKMKKAEAGIWSEPLDLGFDTADQAMNAIKLSEVSPAPLIQEFVDLWHMTKRAREIVKTQSSDTGAMKETSHLAALRIERIDRCLNSTALISQTPEGFAYRIRTGFWHDRWWHYWASTFCELPR